MPKVISLLQPLTYEHKSSAFTIADTGLESRCSSLPHSDTNNCSMSLLLICVNLIFLMLCYNKLFVKQALRLSFARPMCDGRPFASSPFRRLASQGLFFSLRHSDSVALRPYDTLTCYFHSAIWHGKSQSILTQTQRSSELNMVCHRVTPFCPSTCLPVGPVSLGWPLAGHFISQEDASRDHPGSAPSRPSQIRWRRDALQPPEVLRHHLARNTCAHIPDEGFRCISSALMLLRNTPGNGNMLTSRALPEISTSFVFKKHMGRMNSCRLFKSWSPNSACLVR